MRNAYHNDKLKFYIGNVRDYDSNTRILNIEEIKEVLLKVGYIKEELCNHE